MVACAGAAYVAASGVADRHHYRGDVVFGAAVGVAGAQTVAIPRRAGRLTIGAATVPRGAMIAGAWRPLRPA